MRKKIALKWFFLLTKSCYSTKQIMLWKFMLGETWLYMFFVCLLFFYHWLLDWLTDCGFTKITCESSEFFRIARSTYTFDYSHSFPTPRSALLPRLSRCSHNVSIGCWRRNGIQYTRKAIQWSLVERIHGAHHGENNIFVELYVPFGMFGSCLPYACRVMS